MKKHRRVSIELATGIAIFGSIIVALLGFIVIVGLIVYSSVKTL